MRDRSRKTPWDYVHETCAGNRELNKMMKEAFDREEKERAQVSGCTCTNRKFEAESVQRKAPLKVPVGPPKDTFG